MIPRIAAGGSSFKGCANYYLHDKGHNTSDRVAWTQTVNVLTDDPHKAVKVMAFTAKEANRLKEASGQSPGGNKLRKPVFTYSLSWHPEQEPTEEHMREMAHKTIGILGLSEHEAIIVCHRDEPQPHVHVIANRVHPITGLAADDGNSWRKLSNFARLYEREHGKIYCPQREENHRKRERGEKTMYSDPVITAAWKSADTGQAFAAALSEKGYHLAQGRKRLVIVDRYGQTHNPTRHLEHVRAKDFAERLKDLNLDRLPNATELARTVQSENRRRYDESRKHDEAVAQKKAQMQNRHVQERGNAANRFDERILREERQLSEAYGLADQKAIIAALKEKTAAPALWRRVLGFARKDREKLNVLEMNHRNAEWRIREQIDGIRTEKSTALAELEQRQTSEQKREFDEVKNHRPNGYIDEAEREIMREFLEAKSTRNHEAPELDR